MSAGAGKNGGGRRKQRQQRGQTTINQKAAAIAVETAIVVAAETAATEMAAAAAAPTVAEVVTDAAAAGGMRWIVNQSVVCFRKGVDYAIGVKSYNPHLWMVSRIFSYIILHVPTYLGKGGSPTFSDLDVFADRTVLYKFEMRICIKQ